MYPHGCSPVSQFCWLTSRFFLHLANLGLPSTDSGNHLAGRRSRFQLPCRVLANHEHCCRLMIHQLTAAGSRKLHGKQDENPAKSHFEYTMRRLEALDCRSSPKDRSEGYVHLHVCFLTNRRLWETVLGSMSAIVDFGILSVVSTRKVLTEARLAPPGVPGAELREWVPVTEARRCAESRQKLTC